MMNEQCIQQLADVARDRPTHADAWFTLGAARMATGDIHAALEDFGRALAINPNYVEATIARAFALGDTGRVREGYGSMRPLLTVAPDDFALVFASGLFCMRHGWHDTGVTQLRRAVGLLPGAPFARAALAAAMTRIGDDAMAALARGECERLSAAMMREAPLPLPTVAIDHEFLATWPAPSAAQAQLAFARYLQQYGAADESRLVLARVHARNPGHPGVLVEIGRLMSIAGFLDGAEACFRAAVVVQPECHQAMVERSFLAAEGGRMEDAVACLREAVALRPTYPDYRRHLGTLLLDIGRAAEAIEQLEHSHLLNDSDGHTALRLAMAYVEEGRFTDAFLMLDSGNWREWVEAQVLLADTLIRTGDDDTARQLLEAVLGGDPAHGSALSLLGSLGG